MHAMTDIPEDVTNLARVLADDTLNFGYTHGVFLITRAILADRAAQAERMARLEEALRPFALTAASDEEIAARQEEIAPGVMAVVFAAKLDEVMSARRALSQEGSEPS